MESKAPIFPVAETQHYSDYGFDHQVDYFQALHEARRHGKREAARPMDAFRFKLQKPISKDESRRGAKSKKRGKWWRNALLFWKRKDNDRVGGGSQASQHHLTAAAAPCSSAAAYTSPSPYYGYPYQGGSSPMYMTESGADGGSTPCRRSGGGGGACLGSLRLTGSGEVKMPYLCLRDLAAMDASPSASPAAYAPPAVPIYLVT